MRPFSPFHGWIDSAAIPYMKKHVVVGLKQYDDDDDDDDDQYEFIIPGKHSVPFC